MTTNKYPWVPFFAWRPVWTRFHGWTWLRRVWRRRDFAPSGADCQQVAMWPMWEYCCGGPYGDLPESVRKSLRDKPGAEALARELYRVVASGRCDKDGTKLADGKCPWCEIMQRAAPPPSR